MFSLLYSLFTASEVGFVRSEKSAKVAIMAAHLTKEELVEWLRAHDVEFPETATVRHLRLLHASHPDYRDAKNDEEEGGGGNNDGPEDEEADEEAGLDEQLRILQKKKQIADLRRELAGSELPVARPPEFQDVRCLVPPFIGSDSYIPERWLSDFERACDSVGGDAVFRLKCIRRLMEPGTEAEWFLRIDRSTCYAEFRTSFLQNFGHTYSVAEIIDQIGRAHV